ncbi:LuxR family transcriptional regulator [Verminephrobacter aporrectodeae subsp. tuberculatae]|uniref:autoinducer binding domain-containing protein n=1 Tax=Verminephrobacter aporrectodeae TaxID=1110389 RepID=UPI002243D0BD|nr:autoinducer binding domain-containing protein [Verminephrobacter aporrectodeae]MCW8167697.1 LuxR family transcriptional regulator [Verminephrobacter aporrectodeae subsp. tuberculatae]
MENWQKDLIDMVFDDELCEREVFSRIEDAAIALGFEHVAYGFQSPIPLSRPRVILLNNYPGSWQERYAQAGYLQIDPTVAHGRRSHAPIIWTDQVFAGAQNLWDEARAHGLKVGWAQSSLDGLGACGIITLSRSGQPLTTQELDAKQLNMRWFVQVAHIAFSRLLRCNSAIGSQALSKRELEVLKWSADGKSAQDIADILSVSKNTVDFHIKNSITKLQVTNKTAAVVHAALLGFLN